METIQIRVSSKSEASKVAGAIAKSLVEGKKVEVQAIGAGAVNQAVKAIVIARGFVAPNGIDLSCIPAFTNVSVENEDRSAIKFILVVGG